jgi:putative ABC transport system permease protein
MGIPLQGGRLFDATDAADGPRVVVINETMARQFFPSADPVGQHLRVLPSESGPWRTVIGVVADVKSRSLEADIRPQIYLPHTQWPWGGMTVVLLGDGNPLALASAARAELKALDPLLPAAKMRSMQQVVTHATSMRRFSMALLVLFAGAALVLTVVGIYGVVAFLAGRQVREIGIRIALGASRMDVLRLILQQGMKPVAIGGVVGLAGSLGASRMVAGQLYGISPSDPLTLAVIIVLLMAVALLACYIPARRAAKVDPMTALRYE